MPDIPTITVSQAVADRIIAAIQGETGAATQAEAVRNYRKWLSKQLKNFVLEWERKSIDASTNAQYQTLTDSVDSIIDESTL